MAPHPVRHRLELAIFLVGRAAVRALPHRAARGLGASIGSLAYGLSGHHRKIVLDNLRLAFPEWEEARRRQVAWGCFRHLGAMVADLTSLGRLDAVEICRLLSVEGWEHYQEAKAFGRGLIGISGHLGNWEVASYPFFLYHPPFHAVVRPFNNPLVYRYMVEERKRFGQKLIPKSGAARGLFRVVKSGGMGGIVMDQRVRPAQGILVPFFGVDALATPLPAAICLRTGAPALPVFSHTEPDGRYKVTIRPALYPDSGDHGDEAVAAFTQRLLAEIEGAIRERPEQWLWMHRRWRLD